MRGLALIPHQRRRSLLRIPCDSFREWLSSEPPVSSSPFGCKLSCAVDRLTDTQVRTAAAKVGDFPLNIGVGGVGILREQGCRCHDLSGLAIAALRHVAFAPGNLRGMLSVGRQTLDRSDLLPRCLTDSCDAGPDWFPVQVNRASATQGHAAPKLRSREADRVTDDPQKGSLGFDVQVISFPIDSEG